MLTSIHSIILAVKPPTLMPYIAELKIAGIVLAIVGIYTLFVQPLLVEKKRRLLKRYLQVQSLSLNMQDLILKYVLQHDAMRNNVMPGITFKEYLRDLQRSHMAHLSEKRYKKLKKQSILIVALWIDGMLDRQEERLLKVKHELSEVQSSMIHDSDRKTMAVS